jgi:hypothetical protein
MTCVVLEVAESAFSLAAFALVRVIGDGGGDCDDIGLASSAHPEERRPQCRQRRKIAPGSHQTPNSWRPDR